VELVELHGRMTESTLQEPVGQQRMATAAICISVFYVGELTDRFCERLSGSSVTQWRRNWIDYKTGSTSIQMHLATFNRLSSSKFK
jgi:hypothetical protein